MSVRAVELLNVIYARKLLYLLKPRLNLKSIRLSHLPVLYVVLHRTDWLNFHALHAMKIKY